MSARAAREKIQPELFAEQIVSTRDDEFGIAFSPDGETAYFTKRFTDAVRSVRNGLGNIYRIDLDAALPPPRQR
ncbi:MAG TPA: hypothetical protein VGH81_08695 [Rudaea sp.]